MGSSNNNYLKGIEFSENGNYSEAIFQFTSAIKAEENPVIYYERALAFFHLKNNDSALSDLNVACELEPGNPFRYSSRAYIKDKMGDHEGAMEDYKKAIELDPLDAIAQNNLGLLEEKAGFTEMAEKRFRNADGLASKSGLFNEKVSLTGININGEEKGNLKVNSKAGRNKEPEDNFSPQEYLREIYFVFTRKNVWREFFNFILNGGKVR